MTFLFWSCWVINVLILIIAILGKGFRSSFGAGVDFNILLIIFLLIILASSLILRFALKQKGLSLFVVSLPLLAMFVLYLYEKVSGKSI
ncbi:MAG TPA: hypothetical protein VGK46_09230 [Saprospiraceae bacterium]